MEAYCPWDPIFLLYCPSRPPPRPPFVDCRIPRPGQGTTRARWVGESATVCARGRRGGRNRGGCCRWYGWPGPARALRADLRGSHAPKRQRYSHQTGELVYLLRVRKGLDSGLGWREPRVIEEPQPDGFRNLLGERRRNAIPFRIFCIEGFTAYSCQRSFSQIVRLYLW